MHMSQQLDRELVIQAIDDGCEIALLENRELVEFHRDIFSPSLNVGDIYWARVKKIMPPLNAVFVDIGEGKEAFLHYTDLGENFTSFHAFFKKVHGKELFNIDRAETKKSLDKSGKINDVFAVNDYLAVQVLKEPMNTKGARLSAEISLAGRFLVLTPFANPVSISKKISNAAERERLRQITNQITIPNLGVIVRTVAEGMSVKELHEDFLELKTKWDRICQNIGQTKGIVKLFEEQSKSNTLLRDILNDSFTRIHVSNKAIQSSIQSYIQKIAPDKLDIIKSYKNPNLFEEFNLTSKIKSAFNRIIPLPSGGYLIIEYTEAMCVIDVNSGVHKSKKNNLEINESILKINLEAVKEIARQMRLRDIGGIIVIDFIDSKDSEIRERIWEEMQKAVKPDKAKTTVLPLSKFCVMQITRSRTKPQEEVKTKEVCPSCDGTGKITSAIIVTDLIFNKIQSILSYGKPFQLVVHPFVYAYLTKGLFSIKMKWQWKLKSMISLQKNSSLGVNEFQFRDKTGALIKSS